MKRQFQALIAFCLILLMSSPALADGLLKPGEKVSGQLSKSHAAVVIPGNFYECWNVDLEAGKSYYFEWTIEYGLSQLYFAESLCGEAIKSKTSVLARLKPGLWSTKTRSEVATPGGVYGVYLFGQVANEYYTIVLGELPAKTGAKAPSVFPPGAPRTLPVVGWASQGGSGAKRAPGEVFRDCPTCPDMVVLPAGSFTMGSPSTEAGRGNEEGPTRLVTFAHPFAMGASEVTFAEWDACVADGGCASKLNDQGWGRGARPAIAATFADAQQYAAWLSRKTGQAYFIPTEAEWEYAARAGTTTPWNTGPAILAEDANLLNQVGRTVPVKSFPPNGFGLFDVHGNASEWTLDCVDTGYFGAPKDGSPVTSGDCSKRVGRGGSFLSLPADARSAKRDFSNVYTKASAMGFRVARAL